MKIDNKKFPIQEIVYSKNFKLISYPQTDGKNKSFTTRSLLLKPEKVYYLTNPFLSAITKAIDSLSKPSLIKEIDSGTYMFLIPNGGTIHITITNDKEKQIVQSVICCFVGRYLISCGDFMADYSKDKIEEISDYNFSYSSNQDENNETIMAFMSCSTMSILIIQAIIFIQFAQVETKIMPPGSKTNNISCNYRNDTKIPFTILDCKWFTTLVQQEGFLVRGHFHFYWVKNKEGVLVKRLQWVDTYKKEGYNAQAIKLNQN